LTLIEADIILNEYSTKKNREEEDVARTKELNEAMREERREKILSAAVHLFASRGLAGTKISDIAHAAGMSQGLVYHYYASKEEVFVHLIESAFRKLNSACTALLNDPSPPHVKIARALEVLIEGFRENRDASRYHLLIATATASDAIPDEARRIIEKENAYPYEVMEELFRQGVSEGTVHNHDPRELATLFWTTILGLAIYRSSHGEKAPVPRTTCIAGFFLNGEQA
jgi:AcrR family transcriptional regulator